MTTIAHIWKDLRERRPLTERDLTKDSLHFLHNHPLHDLMDENERRKSYELLALTVNESFIYFELALVFADYHYRRKYQVRSHPMKALDHDEIHHVTAFKNYNYHSPHYRDFYRSRNGVVALPGAKIKTDFPRMDRFLRGLLSRYPEAIYPTGVLIEKFSLETSKMLVKDHGKNSTDLFVNIHHYHLIDEVAHVPLCEKQAAEAFARLPFYQWPIYALVTAYVSAHLMIASFLNMRGVLQNLPSLRKSWTRRLRFWLAAVGITDKKTPPFELAMKHWLKHSVPRICQLAWTARA